MLSFFMSPLKTIYRYRAMIVRTTESEVRQKYAGSLAGLSWLILAPLLLMIFYSLIYLLIFRVRPAEMNEQEYVLYILAGLIPFLGFTEALSAGTSSLSTHKAVLLNTVFPAELVPLKAVLACQGTTLVGLVLVLIAATALGKLSLFMLLVPFVWLMLVLFVTGIVWILSLASLVFRDIQQIMTFITMALLIVSPIAYTPDMVPASIKAIIYLNPLSYFVAGFHQLIIFGRLPQPAVSVTIVVLGLFSFAFGFWVFQRAKKAYLEYA